jgi:hypothetical protein
MRARRVIQLEVEVPPWPAQIPRYHLHQRLSDFHNDEIPRGSPIGIRMQLARLHQHHAMILIDAVDTVPIDPLRGCRPRELPDQAKTVVLVVHDPPVRASASIHDPQVGENVVEPHLPRYTVANRQPPCTFWKEPTRL